MVHALQNNYGADRVSKVLTLRTEKSKSAILTACRGLGVDIDIAQYLSGMIISDRGNLRTLKQTFYGDEENDFLPNKTFAYEMTEHYPEVWKVAQFIEGLICGVGSHAGGVIFVDEPFSKTTALMKTANGDIVTQYDLHDAEAASLIKIDLLSIEALDKIHICIDLLCEYNYLERKNTLKETYESAIGIYNLERDNSEMWEMLWNHKVLSLFQMEKQSGIQGISLTKPESVDDLAVLNSVMRLMAPEKGAEQPMSKYARFKSNISLWYKEMEDYGLTEDEQNWLKGYLDISFGICETQEKLMSLVQDPVVGGHSLLFADKLRKSIAKKKPKEFLECQEVFFKTAEEQKLSQKLVHYVWDIVFRIQRGYSFCAAHTLAYSLVGLQELNLAFKNPIIFWNCACLIADSGGVEQKEIDGLDTNEETEFESEEYDNYIEDFKTEDDLDNDSDDDSDENEEDETIVNVKKKKKVKTTNFGKIATAIGKVKSEGVIVTPPNINKSKYTFSPDVDENIIRYGLSGITRVGEDIIKNIICNRPFNSLEDFLSKIKINKPQMINLIKCGAFDFLGDRIDIMHQYIESISDKKNRVTLQNMKMLIDFKLLPEELDFECKVYNFNKYLKKFKFEEYYYLDNIAMNFFDKNFDIDLLYTTNESESGFMIKQTVWEKIYQSYMNNVRPFVKKHHDELLSLINERLVSDMWNKYCIGNISKWEMDSISFYYHDHELKNLKNSIYDISDFNKLPDEPEIDNIIYIKGHQVPLFKLTRIAGTILDKDKAHKSITLLTTTGVVIVKIFGPVFSNYDKQISEKNEITGKKKVIEKSWFSRGNKVIVTGLRREDTFVAKKYAKTPYHLVELITDIDEEGYIKTKSSRAGEVDE